MDPKYRENDFRRIRAALARQEPDRVPAADVDICRQVKSAFLGRPVDDVASDVEFWVQAGYDFVAIEKTIWDYEALDPRAHRATYDYAHKGLRSSRGWLSSGQGVIRSLQDVRDYPWPEEDLDCSVFREVERYMPGTMKSIPFAGGLLTTVWGLMGFEAFCFALIENPGLVEALFERVGRIVMRNLKNACEFSSVGAIFFADDLAYTEGLLVSPAHLRRHFFPWLREAVSIAKRRGLPFIYHTDGRILEVMDDIVEAGVDAIQPIEPKAMDIVEFKKQYGDRICVIGNIDLGYTLTMGTPEEVDAEVRDRIQRLAPGGGYMVSSSNSIPEYVPVENFRAMLESTRKYGKYPIEVKKSW